MPNGLNWATIEPIIDMEPEQAVEFLASKGVIPTWDWKQQADAIRQHAFTIAKVAQAEILEMMKGEIEKSLKDGEPFGRFKNRVDEILQQRGWGTRSDGSSWRLDLIYRTNAQSAFMAGRDAQMREVAEEFPYWEYVAVQDRRTRPAHSVLNGTVAHYKDPFWQSHNPPLGYRCRCRKRAYSADTLKAAGRSLPKDGELINGNGEPVKPTPTTKTKGFGEPPTKPWKPTSGQYSPDVQEALEQATAEYNRRALANSLQNAERVIFRHQQGQEEAVVFDETGAQLLRKIGEDYGVSFTDEDLAAMRGGYLTHNHPRGWDHPEDDPRRIGNSFSPADLHLACSVELSEIRAVTPIHRYSIKPPAGGWNQRYWNNTLSDAYGRADDAVRQRNTTAVRQGEMTDEEAEAHHFHQVWTQVAEELGLTYERIEHGYQP